MKIAILDDYLDVALGLTDWQKLESDVWNMSDCKNMLLNSILRVEN